MAMVKHIFLMSATARGFLAARPFARDNCAKRAVFAGGGNLMDCLPPPTGSRSDLHFCRARAVFRAALILCASFLFSSDALALDAGDTLRVMTFNVRGCKDMTNTRNVAQTANRILAEDPDVCGLQECNDARSAELASATGLHRYFHHDEAILSKEEALSVEVVDLLYYQTYHRDLMIAEFEDYIIANTHMSQTSEYGLPEVDVITNALAKYEGKGKPILFMGDLNTRPGFKVYNKLAPLMQCISPINMADGEGTYCSETNADREYTWNWILDFIYMDYPSARSGEWSWTSHVVKDHVTSDHAPVVADITCQRIKKLEKPRAWVDEEAHTAGLTGTWSGDVVYDWQTFTAPLDGQYVFTPDNSSHGSRVTVDVTATFSDIPAEEVRLGGDVQGAVWIGTNGCFQVWTKELKVESGKLKVGEDAAWLDVEAEGVTPQTGVEYTFRFKFDYRNGIYSASVLNNGTYIPLVQSANPSIIQSVNLSQFPLAASGSALSTIGFDGDGILRSIFGNFTSGFSLRLR